MTQGNPSAPDPSNPASASAAGTSVEGAPAAGAPGAITLGATTSGEVTPDPSTPGASTSAPAPPGATTPDPTTPSVPPRAAAASTSGNVPGALSGEQPLIAVTGSTGKLGSRIARQLANAGAHQRLLVRDPARAPQLDNTEVAQASYGDHNALLDALDGVDTLLLLSATESADRVSLHKATIDSAVAAGVRHIVYTSFVGAAPNATFTFARDHWHTEQHLRATGVDFTFLRDNLYLDFVPGFVGEDDTIRGPAGDGRVAAVLRNDVAASATRVLLDPAAHAGTTYDLTGPTAFSLTEVAALLSETRGRRIRYEPETLDEAYRSRERFGAPAWEVAGWVTSYAAIASGELSTVTSAVEQLTGHKPTGLAEYVNTLL
ncbi:NAD(P)H-binding protein [Kribbella sp. NPDC051770]|uniref:SDR family oxidoreductase n=1 Tax=Kribbella sp. NPDC051770 TaxID=3155413 RepID=UPI0034469F59